MYKTGAANRSVHQEGVGTVCGADEDRQISQVRNDPSRHSRFGPPGGVTMTINDAAKRVECEAAAREARKEESIESAEELDCCHIFDLQRLTRSALV